MKKDEYLKIERYKVEPEGSINKRIYDRYYIPFQEYLKKYYRDTDLLKRWIYFSNKFVKPLFDGTSYNQYNDFLHQAKPCFKPDIYKLKEAWEILKNDDRFDKELKQFFAFICSCSFLDEEWNITFEEFLRIENWMHPWYREEYDNMKPILDILQYQYGFNYLKMLLSGAPWLKVPAEVLMKEGYFKQTNIVLLT